MDGTTLTDTRWYISLKNGRRRQTQQHRFELGGTQWDNEPQIRKPLLYPPELRGHNNINRLRHGDEINSNEMLKLGNDLTANAFTIF